MDKEKFTQLTDQEKYWYLKGYIKCMVESISENMGLSEKVVLEWVVNRLKSIVDM